MSADTIKLYQTLEGPVIEIDGICFKCRDARWDTLFNHPDPLSHAREMVTEGTVIEQPSVEGLMAPIGTQEVWAAGVTYLRSKVARLAESGEAGGGDFYDRVYMAERPELFFKATSHRVVGSGQDVRVRSDSSWSVPEPELALAINAHGQIIGYTIGNDMSARDIEGENPLYLPQAKVYDGCCALGPSLLITSEPLPSETFIRLEIRRGGSMVFEGETSLASMKRTPDELVEFLFRDNSFPVGCYLLTGTGIVPPDDFTLSAGDRIRIAIDPIGMLENCVVQNAVQNVAQNVVDAD